MQTNYCCPGCGRGVTVTTQGDLPPAFQDDGVQAISYKDKDGNLQMASLKNDKGESLKTILNGEPIYWTPPTPPKNPPAPAAEPVATH